MLIYVTVINIFEEIEIDLRLSHSKSFLKQDCVAPMSLPYWVVDWGSSELSGVSLASFKDQFDNFVVAFKALFGYFWLAHSGIYSSNVLIFLEEVIFRKIRSYLPENTKLFSGRLPEIKKLFFGRLLENKELFSGIISGSLPENNFLFSGILLVFYTFSHILWHYFQLPSSVQPNLS